MRDPRLRIGASTCVSASELVRRLPVIDRGVLMIAGANGTLMTGVDLHLADHPACTVLVIRLALPGTAQLLVVCGLADQVV